ncbi:MAG: hypothetical protein HC836_30775 [Richelia sp. RM2_1_2]|nr:hypothetical protein [Richelia sp. SM1_7_0]NJN08813.1 hypothetical protein [Richelia sp. RM1_1_1]NJO28738.1 hypothetical protein [Richelia sp. SL_2_1]NJO62454.1 hypothetical protein [Richelia sp. RM2_1_2]
MFEKFNLRLYLATRSRTAVAHGGDPQDRAALATQTKPAVAAGLKNIAE